MSLHPMYKKYVSKSTRLFKDRSYVRCALLHCVVKNTRSVFTSAAQLRAAQRMCERPFTVYIGEPRLPSVSDNLFVSGFVQVLSDSSVIIGAENSTVKMNYICQFNGTHVHAHDLLLCWLHPQRKA